MIKTLIRYLSIHRYIVGCIGVFFIFFAICLIYAQASSRIRNNIFINNTPVGRLTRAQAKAEIAKHLASDKQSDIKLVIEDSVHSIPASDVGLDYNIDDAINRAWSIGRTPNPLINAYELTRLLFTTQPISLAYTFDSEKMRLEIATIAKLVDQPGKDIRIIVDDGNVDIATDTKIGLVLNQEQAYNEIAATLARRRKITPVVNRIKINPSVSIESARDARKQAERIIEKPLMLTYSFYTFTRTPAQLGEWIKNKVDNTALRADIDEALVSQYVTTIAELLTAEPRSPRVTVVDGKVTDFVAPQSGQQLDQSKTVQDIIDTLNKRRTENPVEDAHLALAVTVVKPPVTDASASELGIIELIGSASTRFTGSPKNRISNIKNGVKFLSGILIKPEEEFSTLKALGKVDNTTGYLPELVIKENETVPEYGGGLCQVSTTLFRATMNVGLPITVRQNHSYRVTYYEKDGEGNYIGPGLDATIYNPAPDFRFINDTGSTILIQGHVEGDKITFDFYGTRDNRTSVIDGPHLLSSTPAGESVYVETDTLPPGEKKQVEKPHPGGSAIATYTITYPDSATKTQVFKSFYRNWPARFLVGANPQQTASSTDTGITNPDEEKTGDTGVRDADSSNTAQSPPTP